MQLGVDRYLESVQAKYARHYIAAIRTLLVATARRDRPAIETARKKLEEVVTETMGIAEVLGATIMLRAAAGAHLEDQGTRLRSNYHDLMIFRESIEYLANTTFEEAVEEMVTRTPVFLRNAAERTAQRIAQLYSEGRVVAFARSAEQAVTERVQSLITQAIRDGIPEAEAGTLIRMGVAEIQTETAAWTESYSRMAFRTNLNTAVTAGRFRQAQDQDIRAVAPCFQFSAVGDADTRENHERADGLVFLVGNPIWNRIAPPLSWNCRCSLNVLTIAMLRRMGRVKPDGSILEDHGLPPGAGPDPGFRHGGRPDLFMVSA